MAKRNRSAVIFALAAVGVLAWLATRRRIVAVTPGTGSGTHNVAVDLNGNPQPGPNYWLETGADGLRRWVPISA